MGRERLSGALSPSEDNVDWKWLAGNISELLRTPRCGAGSSDIVVANSRKGEIVIDMQELFDRYCDFERSDEHGNVFKTTTKLVRVERGIAARIPDLLRSMIPEGKIAVVFDANTRKAAAGPLLDALDAGGFEYQTFLLEPDTGHSDIVCRESTLNDVERLLGAESLVHAIAVGAGTINDIVKMVSFRLGFSFSTLSTAPSNNGTTSAISAILSDGVKTTQPCHATLAAFADPDVMAAAPYRMIASGIGDLYSKPVSNADWRLSSRLLGTAHSDIVMELVNAGAAVLEGVAPLLPSRDPDAVGRLTGALMLSGLAMQAAGSSGPASGGEHLVSHYIDMTSIAHDLPHDFHGCQVAVGTVTTSRLYEEVRALDPAQFDIDALVSAHLEWDAYEPILRDRFGELADAVIAHAKKMYPSRSELRSRLETLIAEWDSIMADVSTTLRPSAELEAELRSADCPTRFDEINVLHHRALDSIRFSKDIRARYTILHLASELGVLDEFAARWVSRV